MATILVIDDDANNRLLVQAVAQHGGHTVLEAGSGEHALAICASNRIDLIILDLGLPGMHGTELLRRLRCDEATQNMPIALYTASRPNAAMDDLVAMYRIRSVIEKPTEPEDLRRAIDLSIG